MALPSPSLSLSLLPFNPLSSSSLLPHLLSLSLLFIHLRHQQQARAMKLKLNSLSPKRLFRSLSRSDNKEKDKDKDKPATPTSVLMSGDWSDLSSADTSRSSNLLDLSQAFKLIDRDNDGLVSTHELEALLKRLLPSHDDHEVAVMLAEVDRDARGCIPLDALLHRFGPPCEAAADDSELREAFEVFDTDQDGKISAEELLSVLTAIGDEGCTLEECRRMIAEVDNNGDGFVCFQDFALMMDLQQQRSMS